MKNEFLAYLELEKQMDTLCIAVFVFKTIPFCLRNFEDATSEFNFGRNYKGLPNVFFGHVMSTDSIQTQWKK